uniref:Mediator of RNA polymerase II transcription subunit 17 n=1 Tax=Xenopus tropicalis TaxID=8364 RepID=A0A803KLU2_XENTR
LENPRSRCTHHQPLTPLFFFLFQTVSINKAINTQEAAVKEKHARNILTKKKGAQTFWTAVNRLPLSSNAVLCWKFCHVFHKLLRDGHPSVLRDSLRYKSELIDMSRMWGHLSEGYGQLCSIYLKLLIIKMEFHTKNPRFPGNLQMTDRQLDEAGENDVNNFFQLTVEIFDYMEWELNLFHTVFKSLDMSRSVSVTAAGQCRLSPLIQVILDCSHLYDYTVKLLFKLHSCELKDLFYRSSNLQYFKRLLQIPQLPENPPNFLRASALSEHISPVVLIPSENSPPDSETLIETEDLVGMDTLSHQSLSENTFDDIFGSSFSNDPFNFSNQNGMRRDDKDHLIEQLYKEIAMLRDEFGNFKSESHRLVTNLKGRIQELEAELAEQKHLREQAVDENEFLRTELEDLKRRREDTEKAQRSLTEIERKSVANEQRYTKLKEKYAELVHSHADLLRKNAEVTKQVSVAREALVDTERSKKELEDSYQRVNEHTQRKELRPPTLDIREEELGDLVEKEMAATAAAVETAATRIEGIQALILASKDLQKEIVESGRGAASQKEFYARNSRWTEGLISASKAVGWGATVMVDAADLVVQGQGKFEDLIVCSHEIAASTAQLVAASKVKAEKDNANLSRLQQASKVVNQNAAGVVASTKCVMSQIEEKDTMDFSSMTLTQIKRKEMDSQVRVLELENELQKEREKLGELRKKHYDLAGVSEGWGDGKLRNWCV